MTGQAIAVPGAGPGRDYTQRRCKRCRAQKPLDRFGLTAARLYRWVCLDCYNADRRRPSLAPGWRGRWRCGECNAHFTELVPVDPHLGYPLCVACRRRYDTLTEAYRVIASPHSAPRIKHDCPEGHPYTPENLRLNLIWRERDGARWLTVSQRCRECRMRDRRGQRARAKLTAIRSLRPALARLAA